LFIIAAYLLESWKPKQAKAFAGIIVAIFGVLTFARAQVWKDSGTFWSDVLEKNPSSYEALNNRGQYFFDNGKYQDAIADYTQSMVVAPGQPYSYNNRSVTYYRLNQYDKSLDENPI